MADIFAEIDPERVKAFLERYRDLEEDRLTEEEQERIQQERPLETGFQPEIILNGRKLRGVEGNGALLAPGILPGNGCRGSERWASRRISGTG